MKSTDASQRKDVLLINMPFGSLFRPAYDLSLLKSELNRRGISALVKYFTLPFAMLTDLQPYVRIANVEPAEKLIGDWIFSEAIGVSSEHYVNEVLLKSEPPASPSFIEELQLIRSVVAAFLQRCAAEVLRYDPPIITFSNSSRQQVSSLALAKQIKRFKPDAFIIFVGKNCEGVMGAELIRSFSDIDAVISGESDIAFPQLVESVKNDESFCGIRGVYSRQNIESIFESRCFPNADRVMNLDALAYPDFDDFFQQHAESGLNQSLKKQIHFETSRGCWWGEKSHCTFCALSDETMAYRSKSADRALQELVYLTSKYPSCDVFLVDNILDLKYFKSFFPRLAEQKLSANFFYETKANLKREHVRLLRECGVTMIQAGVESFNSRILRLMGKGVTALQNFRLLKSCKEFGIKPYWNLLWGFPEEKPEEYQAMAKLLPLLTHLPRPQGAGKIRLERFSPNFERAQELGFKEVRPVPAYFHIYGLSSKSIRNLAFYFEFDYQTPRNVDQYTLNLLQHVLRWVQVEEESDLFYVDKGNSVLICDLRPGAIDPLCVVKGAQRIVFLACDEIVTSTDLVRILEKYWSKTVSVQDVNRIVQPLIRRGFILKEKNSYLSVAIPLGTYSPTGRALERFYKLIELDQAETQVSRTQFNGDREAV